MEIMNKGRDRFLRVRRLRSAAKRRTAAALCRTGVLGLAEHIGKRNLSIITFHRVVTEDEQARSLNKPMMVTLAQFEELLDAIVRYGHPISLGAAVERLAEGRALDAGTVALTFDDGYRELFTRVYPLLRSRGVPATVFVTTSVIDSGDRYLWWDEVDFFASHCAHRTRELGIAASTDLSPVIEMIERLMTYRTAKREALLRDALYGLATPRRAELIEAMRALAQRDGERPRLMLTWDEVRAMSDVVEVGNHTANHLLLDQLDRESIRREIWTARERIEKETGTRCRGFAYPSGVFTADAMAVARECGVEYAVTTRFRNTGPHADLMALGRKDAGYLFVDGRIVPEYLEVVLSGISDWYRREYTWTGSGEMPSPRAGTTDRWGKVDAAESPGETRPLIAHVVHSLAVGGLENGIVNLINHMPRDRYRHVVICLTDYTDFRNRISNPDVEVYALHKRPGKDIPVYLKLWKLIRALRPDIVHTRNLSTLDAQMPAFFACVPHRVHGEHGRDADDLDGARKKFMLLRRLFKPLVHRYVALSLDLARYLRDKVGVPDDRLLVLCNGVDTQLFTPLREDSTNVLETYGIGRDAIVIGTVGRMEAVKDQTTLVKAFVHLVRSAGPERDRLRLVIVGDGTLRGPAIRLLEDAGLAHLAWLPGERQDVSELLRAMNIFVLPSLAEGISNTILEAMASGLPVVATDVGGNSELVDPGCTGFLVPRADPVAMADAIRRYVEDSALRRQHGVEGRRRCERAFSIDTMVRRYGEFYDEVLGAHRVKQAGGSVAGAPHG